MFWDGHGARGSDALLQFVLDEWASREVRPEVLRAAERIMEGFPGRVRGVLFYGSCLRTGEIVDKILDFYVIVDDYRRAYPTAMMAWANWLLPPNVFYHETHLEGVLVRSKYAVVSEGQFARLCAPSELNVSAWARFSQPCQLILPQDEAARISIGRSVAMAMTTMLGSVLPSQPVHITAKTIWVSAFQHTYRAELRSEDGDKGREIYKLDKARYKAVTKLALDALGEAGAYFPHHGKRSRLAQLRQGFVWWLRRVNGKTISFLRLVKASATFDGGIDYLAWKIERHSGVQIEITDWMRRHPVAAGIALFWKLRIKGAFR